MFEPSASDSDRLATARALHADFLPAILQSLAKADDVRSLQVFKQIGRLDFGSKQVFASERRPYAILSESALPHVDALAAVLDNKQTGIFNVSTPLVGQSHFSGSFLKVKISDEMRGFIRETWAHTSTQFDELLDEVQRAMSSKGVKPDNTLSRMLGERRAKNAATMSAIAAATNDPELFAEVGAEENKAPSLQHLNVSRYFPGNNIRAQGVSLAIRFDGIDVLRSLSGPGVLSAPIGYRFDPDDLIADGEELCAGEILEMRDSKPSPELLSVILEKIAHRDLDGNVTYAEQDEAWLRDSLIPKVCGGDWSHLLHTVCEKAPDILALDNQLVQAHAAIFSLPTLLERTLRSTEMDALESESAWFAGEHPLSRVVKSAMEGKSDRGDLDASMLLIIEEMAHRGQHEALLTATLPGDAGGSIAHFCAAMACDKTLVRLVELGLDLNVRDKQGIRIESSAEAQGHEKTALLVRSMRSSQAARHVLDEIEASQEHSSRDLAGFAI